MSIVIDASAALAWCLRDEASEQSERLLAEVAEAGCHVPGLWHLEMANALLAAQRKGRISSVGIDGELARLSELRIMVDDGTAHEAWGPTLELARRHGLTLYDAAYLELAVRMILPLATLDRALARAAVSEKVPLRLMINPEKE